MQKTQPKNNPKQNQKKDFANEEKFMQYFRRLKLSKIGNSQIYLRDNG